MTALDSTRADQMIDQVEKGADKWDVDRMLRHGRTDRADRRAVFVGIDTYRAEGGAITGDLFADATVIHDEPLLDKLFATKLALKAEQIDTEQGWAWVRPSAESCISYTETEHLIRIKRTPGALSEADTDEFDRLTDLAESDLLDEDGHAKLAALQDRIDGDYTDEDRATGGVFVYVDRHGDLTISYVYRARGDSTGTPGADDSSSKMVITPITNATLGDLHRIETLAYQHALIDKPDLVLDLLALQLARRRPYDTTFDLQIADAPTDTPVDAGDSLIVDQRWADTSNSFIGGQDSPDMAAAFCAFRAEGQKHRNKVLALHLACAFRRPVHDTAPLGRLIATEAGVNIRKHWTPDAPTLFARCTTDHLTTIYAELPDCARDDDSVAAFDQQKKTAKAKELHALMHDAPVREARCLSRADNTRIDAWLPRALRGEVSA